MIDRPLYMQALERWKDKDVIKVVTGVRRCGKSTLLSLYQQRLLAQGVKPECIVDYNMELLENEPLLDYHKLHDAVINRCRSEATHYVFLDEIQNVPNFQKAVDSLHTRNNIDLYITGSNAFLLRGTLATLISGRYVEVQMLPLSFAEFVSGEADDARSATRAWSDYIHEGGFPAIGQFRHDETAVHDYLEGILSTILLKDVAQRLNISNIGALNALTSFLFDGIGNMTSVKRISDELTRFGNKIAPQTVEDYLEGLCASYIFYPVQRYDLRGRRLFKTGRKYYAVDPGLRRIACSNDVRDSGRLLENVVYFELLRREKQVYIGQSAGGEIDFVTNGAHGRRYYQVCLSTENPETLQRELSSLRALHDNFPKTLITMDDKRPTSHDGINQVYALDWLLGTA